MVPRVSDCAIGAQLLDKVFIEEVTIALVIHRGAGVVVDAGITRHIEGRINRIRAQVGVPFNKFAVGGIVGLEVAIAAIVVGILQIMLGLVVNRPLAAIVTYSGRIDADPAIAGASPIGDPRPANAIFHAHVKIVAATGIIEMMTGIGKVALPRFFKPFGHLFGFPITVDPVLQGIGGAIFGAHGGGHVLGVPDGDRFAGATNGKVTGNTLIQGDAVNRGAAGTGRGGRHRAIGHRRGTKQRGLQITAGAMRRSNRTHGEEGTSDK